MTVARSVVPHESGGSSGTRPAQVTRCNTNSPAGFTIPPIDLQSAPACLAVARRREDIAVTPRDGFAVWMDRAVPPVGRARSDCDILAGVAGHMGLRDTFTEGRDAGDWIRHIYDRSRQRAAEAGIHIPTLPELKSRGWFEVAPPKAPQVLLADFRADPDAHPLDTPSGRIEIWSETIAGFGYDDCPPHPAWMEPAEWLGNAPASTATRTC